MKKCLGFILMVVLSIGIYLPCRELAIMERGNTAYGGEVLVPVMVFLTYIVLLDYWKETSEVPANKGGTKQEDRKIRKGF